MDTCTDNTGHHWIDQGFGRQRCMRCGQREDTRDAEIARLTAELAAAKERERVLREAVVEGLAVAVGCKGRIALTLFHVDRIRAALGEP